MPADLDPSETDPSERVKQRPERPRAITVAAVLFTIGGAPWLMFGALGTLRFWMACSAFLLLVVVSVSAYVGTAGIRIWATVLVSLSCVLLAVPLVAVVVVLGQGPPGLALVMLVPTGIITVLGMACALVGVRLLYVSASGAYLTAVKAGRSAERRSRRT